MAQFKEKPGDVSMNENREIERDNRKAFEEREKQKEYDIKNNPDKYSTYPGMSSGKGHEIIVHSYSNSRIGHYNVEFRSHGKRDGWLGANVNDEDTFSLSGLNGGIYHEANKSIKRITDEPHLHKATVLNVSEAEYRRAFEFAKNKAMEKNKDYDILGHDDHCVSFADKVLKNVNGYGQKGKTLGDMAVGNTLAAQLAKNHYSNGHFSSPARNNDKERPSRITPARQFELYAAGNVKISMDGSSTPMDSQNAIFKSQKKYEVSGDAVISGSNNDYLYGTQKNDLLSGGAGNDYYVIYKGQGDDIIHDTQGRNSILFMNSAYHRLWFSREHNHLKVTLLDGNSSTLYENYFTHKHTLQNIHSVESNKRINAAGVDKLVQAMAAFTPPSSVSEMNHLLANTPSLQATLAANWT